MKQNLTLGNLSDVGTSQLSAEDERATSEVCGLIPRNNSADFNKSSFLTNNLRYSVPVPCHAAVELATSSQIITNKNLTKNDPQLIYQTYSGEDLSQEKIKSAKRISNWYQYLAPSYRQKAQQFRRAFIGSSVDTDRLLVDYSCALYHNGLLTQGRMYITEEWICFYTKIIHESKIMISVKEIVSITKQKTAKLIPNAIQIIHGKDNDRYFFTSFAAREKTFAILNKVWENFLNQQSMSVEEIIMQVRQIYGDDSVTAMMESSDNPALEHDSGLQNSTENENEISQTSINKALTNGLENSSLNFLISPKNSASLYLGNKKKSSVSRTRLSENQEPNSLSQTETKDDLTESFNTQTSTSQRFDEMANNLTDSVDEYLDESNTTDTDFNFSGQMDNLNAKFPAPKSGIAHVTHQGPAKCGNGHEHLGRQYADCEIPLNIDVVFKALFTCCNFTETYCQIRSTSDYHVDNDWNILPTESDTTSGDIERKIHYTVALKQKLGPRCCLSNETQKLLVKETIPHRRYVIDTVVTNENVPLCTCFHSECRYCLLSINKYTTHLKVSAQVIFDKQVFFGAKNIIESTFRTNIAENFYDLTESLIQQAKQMSRPDQLTGGDLIKSLNMKDSTITKPLNEQNSVDSNTNHGTSGQMASFQQKSQGPGKMRSVSDCSNSNSFIVSCVSAIFPSSFPQLSFAWIILIFSSCILGMCLYVMYSTFLEFETMVSDWHQTLQTLASNGKCINQPNSFPFPISNERQRAGVYQGISAKLQSLELSFQKILSLVGELRETIEGLEKTEN